MNLARSAISFLTLLTTALLVSCGGSSNRVLQSISIAPNPAAAPSGTAQLVATGTFSAPPVTVTPLAVDWSQSPCDNLCAVSSAAGSPALIGPVTVSNSGLATCAKGYSGTVPVKAVAPSDPSLAPDTQNVPVVTGTGNVNCQ